MNGIAFRSYRKRNMFQKNAITVYSEYSYSGIVPKERALREGGREGYGRRLREGVKEVQRRRRDRREGKRGKVQRKTDRGSGREGMSFRERVWLGEREEERRLFRNIVRKKQNSSFQNKQVHQFTKIYIKSTFLVLFLTVEISSYSYYK